MRQVPKGDGIPYQRLYVKSVLSGRQPIQWRRGILYGAFKGSGAQEVAESHRSLYISSFASKVLHKALRQKVDSQVPITDDRTVEELSYRFGLDATDIVEFKEVILKGSMMAKAGVPGPIQQATGDFHYKTLFPDMPTGTDSVSPERARAQERRGPTQSSRSYIPLYSIVSTEAWWGKSSLCNSHGIRSTECMQTRPMMLRRTPGIPLGQTTLPILSWPTQRMSY